MNNIIDEYFEAYNGLLQAAKNYAYSVELTNKDLKRHSRINNNDILKLVAKMLSYYEKLKPIDTDTLTRVIIDENSIKLLYYKECMSHLNSSRKGFLQKLSTPDLGCFYDNRITREILSIEEMEGLRGVIDKIDCNNLNFEIAYKRFDYLKSINQEDESTFKNNFDKVSPIDSVEKEEHLVDIIAHEKSDDIVKALKEKLKNIKGKQLKLLFRVLKNHDLLSSEQSALQFHNLCRIDFDWDIKTYQAMNGYSYNSEIDKVESDRISRIIKQAIKT